MWPGRPAAWSRIRLVWRSISGERGEQDDRVEVPLDGDAGPEPVPGLRQVDPPVEADDLAAGVALELEERAGVGPEVDRRDGRVELREEPRHVRLDEPAIIVGAEVADPAIEELERPGPPRRPGRSGRARSRRPGPSISASQAPGSRYMNVLACLVVPRPAPLDRVAGQRERGPGEADQRESPGCRADRIERTASKT